MLLEVLKEVRIANKRFQERSGVILNAIVTVFEPLRNKLQAFRDNVAKPRLIREFCERVLEGFKDRLTEKVTLADGSTYVTGNMPERFAQALIFDPESAYDLFVKQGAWEVANGSISLTKVAVTSMLVAAFKACPTSDYNKDIVLSIAMTEGVRIATVKLDAAKASVPTDAKAIAAASAELKAANDRIATARSSVLTGRTKKFTGAIAEQFNSFFLAVENCVFTKRAAHKVACDEAVANKVAVPEYEPVDALAFWREKKSELDLLAEVAPNFFCLDLVSSEIERFFSRCGLVMPPRRNRLGKEKEEIFMVASYNLTRDMKAVSGSSRAEIAARNLWNINAADLDFSDGEE